MANVDESNIRWRHGSGRALIDDINADRAARDAVVLADDALQPATGSDAVETGAAPVAVDPAVAVTVLTTGGTQGAESITLADGTVLGQRKLIQLGTLTDPGDSVVLGANIVDTSITFDAANEEVLLEFDGADWAVVLNNGTTVA